MKSVIAIVVANVLREGHKNVLQDKGTNLYFLSPDTEKWPGIVEELARTMIAGILAERIRGGAIDETFARCLVVAGYEVFLQREADYNMVGMYETMQPAARSMLLDLAHDVINTMQLVIKR